MGTSTTAHIWFGSVIQEDSELMDEISESGEWGDYLMRKYAEWKGVEIPTHERGWTDFTAFAKDLCFEVDSFGYQDNQIYVLRLKQTGTRAYCIDAKYFDPLNLTFSAEAADTLKEFTDALGLQAPGWLLAARVF